MDTCAFGTNFLRNSGELKAEKKRQKNAKNVSLFEQKVKKSGKIEKKVTKWHVLLCVFVKNCTPDTNASFNVKMGKLEWGKISVSK